jgi:hypothetical protein
VLGVKTIRVAGPFGEVQSFAPNAGLRVFNVKSFLSTENQLGVGGPCTMPQPQLFNILPLVLVLQLFDTGLIATPVKRALDLDDLFDLGIRHRFSETPDDVLVDGVRLSERDPLLFDLVLLDQVDPVRRVLRTVDFLHEKAVKIAGLLHALFSCFSLLEHVLVLAIDENNGCFERLCSRIQFKVEAFFTIFYDLCEKSWHILM